MEESLRDALVAAGERLAEALRLRLSESSLPSELHVIHDGDRVVVASQSAELRQHEVGQAGVPPKAMLEAFSRDAMPEVLDAFVERLGSIAL